MTSMDECINFSVLMDISDAVRKTELLKMKIGEFAKLRNIDIANKIGFVDGGNTKKIETIDKVLNQMAKTANSTNKRFLNLNRSMSIVNTPFSGGIMKQNTLEELKQTQSIYEKLSKTVQHNVQFMAGAAILGGAIGIPTAVLETAGAIETLSKKIEQNLELADRYHNV